MRLALLVRILDRGGVLTKRHFCGLNDLTLIVKARSGEEMTRSTAVRDVRQLDDNLS
jgi:hypothetical protein